MESAASENVFAYLGSDSFTFPMPDSPRLITPAWFGEPGVRLAVILTYDDLRFDDVHHMDDIIQSFGAGHVLKPLNLTQDGSDPFPVTFFFNGRSKGRYAGREQTRGIEFGLHSIDHKCAIWNPLPRHEVVNMINDQVISGWELAPSIFRLPCCDHLHRLRGSPLQALGDMFYALRTRVQKAERCFSMGSIVSGREWVRPTPACSKLFANKNLTEFRYIKGDSSIMWFLNESLASAFINATTSSPRHYLIQYPFPYVVNGTIWEFPFSAPSDVMLRFGGYFPQFLWDSPLRTDWVNSTPYADNGRPPAEQLMYESMHYAWMQKGIFVPLLHSPVSSSSGGFDPEHLKRLFEFATHILPGTRFITFKGALARIRENVLLGQELRDSRGLDNGVRLLDVNGDGFLDVVVGNDNMKMSNVWSSDHWETHPFPFKIVSRGRSFNISFVKSCVFGRLVTVVQRFDHERRSLAYFASNRWTSLRNGAALLDANQSCVSSKPASNRPPRIAYGNSSHSASISCKSGPCWRLPHVSCINERNLYSRIDSHSELVGVHVVGATSLQLDIWRPIHIAWPEYRNDTSVLSHGVPVFLLVGRRYVSSSRTNLEGHPLAVQPGDRLGVADVQNLEDVRVDLVERNGWLCTDQRRCDPDSDGKLCPFVATGVSNEIVLVPKLRPAEPRKPKFLTVLVTWSAKFLLGLKSFQQLSVSLVARGVTVVITGVSTLGLEEISRLAEIVSTALTQWRGVSFAMEAVNHSDVETGVRIFKLAMDTYPVFFLSSPSISSDVGAHVETTNATIVLFSNSSCHADINHPSHPRVLSACFPSYSALSRTEYGRWTIVFIKAALQSRKLWKRITTEAREAGVLLRSMADMLRLGRVRQSLDLSSRVEPDTTFYEVMTFHQTASGCDLALFEDKLALRGFQRAHNIPSATTLYMSNNDPYFLSHIIAEPDFVVKPTHLSEGEYVFVVRSNKLITTTVGSNITMNGTTNAVLLEGMNLKIYIQERIMEAWRMQAYPWECAALRDARPGVLVEKPVLDASGEILEIQCTVIWGRCRLWHLPLRDTSLFVPECRSKVARLMGRVGDLLRADMVRVDVLVGGSCTYLAVSEVELYPGRKLSWEMHSRAMKYILYGYGQLSEFEDPFVF